MTEGRLRLLLRAIEHTTDAVFITDVRGVIEYVNPALEALTGFTRDDLVGRTPRMFQSGRHSPDFYVHLWSTLLAGEVYRGMFINRRRDGTVVHCEETIVPLFDESGRISNFMAVGRDLSERVRVEEHLRQVNQSLEQQAKRIARSLHDEAGQFLTAAYTSLAAARRAAPGVDGPLREVERHLDQIEEQLRRIAHELRPRILDDLGLVPALEFLVEGVRLRTGISVVLEARVPRRLTPAVETTVYRLLQEALTNVTRHSRAQRVVVRVRQRERLLRCSVRDDGVGFEAAAVLGGVGTERFGLVGIREQLAALGGSLEIDTAPGRGTELIIAIPLED